MRRPDRTRLASVSALEHPDLLGPTVAEALASWPHAADVAVVEIDPALADTAALNAHYSLPVTASANCVVVAGRRDGQERVAACVVRADTRADVNNLVKRTLDVRKCSFLSTERAKAITRGINERCRTLRPYAETLVDGLGIPEQLRYAEMLHPENIVDT